jgi:hypothetical protein
MEIVSVKFQDKANRELFSGREYSYRAPMPVNVGDIVMIPVKNATAKAKVVRVNIKDSELTFNPMLLKDIVSVEYSASTDEKKSNKAVMKNWSLTSDNSGYLASELTSCKLQGQIYEDSRKQFPDGSQIITSQILGIVGPGPYKIVITQNTCYTVYPDDVDPEYEKMFPGAFERLRVTNKE